MVIMVYMIVDEKNQIPKWAQPSFICAMLVTVGMGFGLNAGNAMSKLFVKTLMLNFCFI
jgi:hypothetical protein